MVRYDLYWSMYVCGSMYVLNRDVYKMGLFMCYKVRYVLYWSIYVLYRDMYVLYG